MTSLKIVFYSLNFMIILTKLICFCSGQQCDEQAVEMFDGSFAKLLTLGEFGRAFPENKQEQLETYCNQTSQFIKDIDEFKDKCMKRMQKHVTGVVVYSVENAINEYCKQDSTKLTQLIEATPCPNHARKEFDLCYNNLIDNFQGALNAEESLRIPHICCEYHKLFDCLRDKALTTGKCSEAQVETISGFVKDLFSKVVDLLCSHYTDGSDKCDLLGPVPPKLPGQFRTKSVIVPLFETLGEWNH